MKDNIIAFEKEEEKMKKINEKGLETYSLARLLIHALIHV